MNPIKIGAYVTTNSGYTGFVIEVGHGQLHGLVTVQIGAKNGHPIGVTEHEYAVTVIPAPLA